MLKDDEIRRFKDEFEMESFMDDIHSNTTWLTADVENISFSAISDETSVIGADEATVDTIRNGTQLFLDYDDNTYPIRCYAVQSIQERLGISGIALKKMTASQQAEIYSMAAKVVNKKTRTAVTRPSRASKNKVSAMLSIVDGKVNCLLSEGDNKNDYQRTDSRKMLEELQNSIIDRDEEILLFDGQYSYTGIAARWLIDNEVSFNGQKYRLQYNLSTSDIGLGAVTINATLRGITVSESLPIFDTIAVEHRQGNSLDFYQLLEELNASLSNAITDVEALKDIPITYVEDCMRRVGKYAHLPQRELDEAIKRFLRINGSGKKTALDLFLALSKYLIKYDLAEYPVRIKQEGNVRRMVKLDWKSFDYPLSK